MPDWASTQYALNATPCWPCVGRALGKLHGQPAHDWTLDELARQSGLSRSVLAERFAQFVGLAPM